MREREQATVDSVFFGIEKDLGCLTFWIMVAYDAGCAQGFGGVNLVNVTEGRVEDDRSADVATRFLVEMLDFFGVKQFPDIKGKRVVAIREEGWNGKILGLEREDGKRWMMDDFRRRYWPSMFTKGDEG